MKIFNCKVLAIMCCAMGLCLTSCGDDNDEPAAGPINLAPVPGGSVSVNPSDVFTAGIPAKVGDVSVVCGSDGLVQSLTDGDVTVTFSYPGVSRADSYDVVMNVNDGGATGADVFSMLLNEAGFVRYCHQLKGDGTVDEWWFDYNASGQLVKMKRTEGDNEVTDIVYDGGDIVKVTMRSDDPDDGGAHLIGYGAAPINNKGCLMLFDETFGIDMDEMEYAYFAGLLGKATRNLPTERTEDDGDRSTYEWALNGAGLPIKLVSTDLRDGYTEEQTLTFEW